MHTTEFNDDPRPIADDVAKYAGDVLREYRALTLTQQAAIPGTLLRVLALLDIAAERAEKGESSL